MELGSLIFGLFTLACFIVPVIYLQNVKKQEKKKFLQDFNLLAKQQGLEISQADFWNHSYAIGIDSQKQKLFYLKKNNEQEQKILVDLAELVSCQIINKSRYEQDTMMVDHVLLSLTYQNPGVAEKTLEFYDKNESMTIDDELQLSEKWNTIINSQLKLRPLNPTSIESEKTYLRSA